MALTPGLIHHINKTKSIQVHIRYRPPRFQYGGWDQGLAAGGRPMLCVPQRPLNVGGLYGTDNVQLRGAAMWMPYVIAAWFTPPKRAGAPGAVSHLRPQGFLTSCKACPQPLGHATPLILRMRRAHVFRNAHVHELEAQLSLQCPAWG